MNVWSKTDFQQNRNIYTLMTSKALFGSGLHQKYTALNQSSKIFGTRVVKPIQRILLGWKICQRLKESLVFGSVCWKIFKGEWHEMPRVNKGISLLFACFYLYRQKRFENFFLKYFLKYLFLPVQFHLQNAEVNLKLSIYLFALPLKCIHCFTLKRLWTCIQRATII